MNIGDGLTREERETIIWFSEGSDTVTITTASPVFVRRLEQLAAAWGVPLERRSAWDVRATLPKKALRFSLARALSEAQRAHLDAMRARRAAHLAAVGDD